MEIQYIEIMSYKQKNCVNIIRILAAFQVFYGHATAYLSLNMPEPLGYIMNIIPGVPTFFAD